MGIVEGSVDGRDDGTIEGVAEGWLLGCTDELDEGTVLGRVEGASVGLLDGMILGWMCTPKDVPTDDPCAAWEGIVCDGNSSVTAVQSPGSGVRGSLPTSVGYLTALQTLSLAATSCPSASLWISDSLPP